MCTHSCVQLCTRRAYKELEICTCAGQLCFSNFYVFASLYKLFIGAVCTDCFKYLAGEVHACCAAAAAANSNRNLTRRRKEESCRRSGRQGRKACSEADRRGRPPSRPPAVRPSAHARLAPPPSCGKGPRLAPPPRLAKDLVSARQPRVQPSIPAV
jgi:hypothetical protein